MSCSIFSASAQIYIKVRPPRPAYVRVAAPSPRHVWIDEDWHGNNGNYEWRGGRWEAPPQPGYRYSKGYWRHTSQGHRWHEGRWHK